MDNKNIQELLDYILFSIDLIEERFSHIEKPDSFLNNNNSIGILDSISMRLQTIGEALKSIYKRNPSVLLSAGTAEYWSEIIKLREIISHHYIDIDAEVVFDICETDLSELKTIITKIKATLQSPL